MTATLDLAALRRLETISPEEWTAEETALVMRSMPALLAAAERDAQVRAMRDRIADLAPTRFGYGEHMQKIARGDLLRDLLALLPPRETPRDE